MPAELTYANGTANMFYAAAGGTPWHHEGVPIEDADLFDFDGVMTKHFDWEYEKRPYYVPTNPDAPPDERQYVEGAGAFYVWCKTSGKNLGMVGADYELVGNREAFAVLKPLVDDRVLTLETGGVLRHGADTWLMGKWDLSRFGPDTQEVFGRADDILPYATVMANHSGRRGILIGCTSIRVVCANTLGAAERDAQGAMSRWRTIRHTPSAHERLTEAATELFGDVVGRFERIARQYKLLMACRLDGYDFDRLVLDAAAPDPREDERFNPEARLADLVVERVERKRAEIRRLWFEGRGHTGEPTAWFALNGLTEALDHNRDLWPTRRGAWRTASLLDGELARVKNLVTDNLVSYALSA